MLRLLGLLALIWTLAVPSFAQEMPADARAATGGAHKRSKTSCAGKRGPRLTTVSAVT